MTPGQKKILIADDHVIIRRGLKVLLDNYFGREHRFEASSAKEILELLRNETITHLILDMQLKDTNVMEVLPFIIEHYPEARIMIYTMSQEEIFGPRLIDLGVAAFLSKQSEEEEVLKALDLFFNGRRYISATLGDVMQDRKHAVANPISQLSDRELSVLSHLLKGESVKEISVCLDLKATTVATYKARLYEKLGVGNLVDLQNVAALYRYNGS